MRREKKKALLRRRRRVRGREKVGPSLDLGKVIDFPALSGGAGIIRGSTSHLT